MLLTGGAWSAIRALVMAAIAALLLLNQRRTSSMALLATAALLDKFPINDFWSAIAPADLHPALRRALIERSINVHQLSEGWTEIATGPARLAAFVPDQSLSSLNDRTVMVLAEDRTNRVLLSGALGRNGLHQLAADQPEEPINLLKLPHHGSRHSAPPEWLEQLNPAMALISAGRGNSYRFPHRETIEACLARDIPLLRTDQEETLRFVSTPEGWQRVSTWLP